MLGVRGRSPTAGGGGGRRSHRRCPGSHPEAGWSRSSRGRCSLRLPGSCRNIWKQIPFSPTEHSGPGASHAHCSLCEKGLPISGKNKGNPRDCTPVSEGRREATDGPFHFGPQFPHLYKGNKYPLCKMVVKVKSGDRWGQCGLEGRAWTESQAATHCDPCIPALPSRIAIPTSQGSREYGIKSCKQNT